jgi:predicted NAD/FAD-binding protein
MRILIVRAHDITLLCFLDQETMLKKVTLLAQFNRFLGELGVETIPTDMSFGVSTANGSLEWGSHSLWSFVGTVSNLFSPWFWRLIFDALRFSLFAMDICDPPKLSKQAAKQDDEERSSTPFLMKPEENAPPTDVTSSTEDDLGARSFESIGDYIVRQGYSHQFLTYYLIPLVAAPWCIDPDEFARSFPAKTLIKFMYVPTTALQRGYADKAKGQLC